MKKNFLYIAISFLIVAVYSCSNDFLNENTQQGEILTGDSQIMLSPSWNEGMNDYSFFCLNAGEADFIVESAPDWIEVETESGELTVMPGNDVSRRQSMGTIRCKAKTNPEFENTGVGMYLDKIRISVNGKPCYVPVMYVVEGNPKIKINPILDLDYNGYTPLIIQNEGEGILLWDIISMPDWLAVETNAFNPSGIIIPQGSSSEVPLTFNIDSAALTNKLNGDIVLKTNDKEYPEVTINVGVNLGSPQISLSETSINFGRRETSKSFSIYKQGNGLLIWSLENLPEWLSVTKSSGTLYSYHSENITFTCNRDLVPDGTNEATVILKTNDVNNPKMEISIYAHEGSNSANVFALEGNIVDACYDKSADMLYYATSQPNKLIAYNTQTRSIAHEIALSNDPTSLAVSEDFTKAVVGQAGQMSAIDLSNFELTKTIELDFSVYDMVWASEDWFCCTKETTNNSYYESWLWINTTTGEMYENLDIGQGYVYKIPNQPFIIGTRTNIFPTGIYVINAETKEQKAYAHTDLGKIWFSEDGNYIFESNRIYRTSAFTSLSGRFANDPLAINNFFHDQDYNYAPFFTWIDHSSQVHAIWVVRSDDYYYYSGEDSQIYQFEDTNYSLVKSYFYEDYYQEINGYQYQVLAHYLFANSTGAELSVLRKGVSNNNWSIEFIEVTD